MLRRTVSDVHSAVSGLSVPLLTLPRLLHNQAKHRPDAPAILAPSRTPLTYRRLSQHIDDIASQLRAMGIGRHDRVAIMLPNGPDLAVAILAVACSATCAVMNPAYGADELDRYFADLRPRALITQRGIETPARHAALSRGIRILELASLSEAEAGLFTLTGSRERVPSAEAASADDVALLLLTSGTTSRPKIVPLSHANICASAYASAAALALTETDRCLNILPLFHGHGLVATILASLAAGASVVCTPGCEVNSFFAWMTEFRPTWYSAVPTMHQAILAHARHHPQQVPDRALRFVRSASAPLPPPVFAELERIFGTCVIEFYGMTETSSAPIGCNPLPPRARKAGSVGMPVGLDVAIMDEAGTLLPDGRTGEVVVRGPSITNGYDGDPIATQAAFADGWFKTGDQGFFDKDGYLFLVGRQREMVNRGGENIAPREVEEVLLEHPAVAEAVTFAVPHRTLGEDVASAVVLRPGAAVDPKEIRQFALRRLAEFKVPRQIIMLPEIPKGPTGKVQRVELAVKLGLVSSAGTSQTFAPPRTQLEAALAGFWAELLGVEKVGIHDDFFALGGDSLLATQVLTHAYEIAHVELDVSRFFEGPTVADVAAHLEGLIGVGKAQRPAPAITRAPREAEAPASVAQERLLKLQKALPGIPFFNILYALRLTSPVDGAVLERSINEIVRRHEILRTTFAVVDGRYVQVVAPHLHVPVQFHDLHAISKSRRDAAAHNLVQQELVHPFDLAHGPLVRTLLLRLAKREHLLLVSMHQAIVDGWSLGVFAEELAAIYEAFADAKTSPLVPLSVQYADFASWQRDWRSHPEMMAQLAYWREQLRHPLPVMKLSTARRRRLIDRVRTARRDVMLPASLADALRRFSHQEGGTLFMALTAALKILLHRRLGETDLRVATNVAARNRPETAGLIGPLANTVILRTHLDGDLNSRQVLRQVRATTLAAFAHQDLPFEELVDVLEDERAVKPAALAQVMLLLQNATLRQRTNSANRLTFEEANPHMLMPLVTITSFDIILMLSESSRGLVGTCVYKPALFAAKTIDRFLHDFQEVLEQMLAQPEQPISAIHIRRKKKRSL